MKIGSLVKWTFAKTSDDINPSNCFYFGILLRPEIIPVNSWHILLSNGDIIHGDETEIEVIREIENG